MDQLFVSLKQGLLGAFEGALPEWVLIIASIMISVGAIAALGPVIMMYLTLLERKIVGRIQNRIGPNRVGKYGLLQPLADGVKMLTKEDIVPDNADKTVHLLAPLIIVAPALLVFAVIPFGRNMTAVDLNVGVLFFLAVSSTTTIAILMASWASRNKYSLLGGMRAAAQMISYEIPMALSVVPILIATQTLSTNAIVEAQSGWGGFQWFVFTPWGFAAFIVFFLCGVAETNRSPFDLAEAESEIIAGFHTEYSGMKFALFYMAEFMNAFTISAFTVTLFLGGWQGPLLPSWMWFFIKTYSLIFILLWFRGTLPRFRVDQLMNLAWKFLLPFTMINILVAGFWYFSTGIVAIVVSTAALLVTFWILTKANITYLPEKRVYPYGD